MATMRSIGANRAMETTETTGTGAYALEGPVAGYTDFRSTIATGQKVAYCVQQASYDGNGDLIGMDYEIGIGTLTHGSPDTLARTLVLQSTNGDAAVNWGPGVKTIFATLPAELVPVMAAALTSGQAGKALVVDATSRYFELGGPYLPLAGGVTVTGPVVFEHSANDTLVIRDTRNTDDTVVSPLRFEGGDGSGNDITFRFVLDGANGIKRHDVNFTSGGSLFSYNRDGRLTLGADGSGGTDAVTKQQMDAAIPAIADQSENEAGTVNTKTTTPLGIRQALRAAGAAPIFACRAWVRFTGAAGAIEASGNVSSVTRTNTGRFVVNFATAMPDANYDVQVTGQAIFGSAYAAGYIDGANAPTPAAVSLLFLNQVGGNAYTDPGRASVSVHR